jgi:nitrogen-specific signal transduction histidine kinase/CheY-like chemotaxis protein
VVQEASESRTVNQEREHLHLQNRHSELMARMGAITRLIVHDLRQPLAAILSNAQAALNLLGHTPQDLIEIRKILEDIIFDEKRASGTLGKISSTYQRGEARRDEVCLAATVQEALDVLHEEIADHGIQSRFLREQDFVVRADGAQIRRVIIDLITNSIEAMQNLPAHQRRLDVTLALANPEMAQITVSDSGPGIPDSDIGKLFNPFWTTKERGMGFGLYICRSTIQAHGGSIQHYRNQDGGAAFCFTLPLAAAVGPGKKRSESGSASAGAGLKTMRALIVDDSEPYRRTTWSILKSFPSLELAGEAVDGLEAVRKALELKPDLVLMDVSLTGINGIEAATQIRKTAPETKILFLSQFDDTDIVRAILHTGALGYVLKVDSGKDLLTAVATVLRGKMFLSSGVPVPPEFANL